MAVILKGEKESRSEISREMSDAAYDVMLETGVLIGPLPLWEEGIQAAEYLHQPGADPKHQA